MADNDTPDTPATPTTSGTPDPAAPVDDRTWGPGEVGKYLGCSAGRVNGLVSEDPDFPPPLMIGTRIKRWLPSAVHAYVRRAHERRLPVRDPAPARRIVERV
jgi:predicted DNA-binding transcriptional regulator AlpA